MRQIPALEGIRVLDLSSVGPGARASRILADYGAAVTKVGAAPRAGSVQITPPFYAYGGHRGMTRALFDLKAAAGRDAFQRLADRADVLIESFRPGVADKLGIGYDAASARNPNLVYCSTSGYGQTGPRSQWAGHDLDYLAVSGYLDCSGRRTDGSPALPGATVADIAAGGMHAAMSVMAALLRRVSSGRGEHLDVSVADGALAMMSLCADEYLATGVEPGPGHNILTGRYACYDVYACGDGRHLAVAAIEPQFWRNLCRLLDLEHLTGAQLDDTCQDAVRGELAATLGKRPRDEWVGLLSAADTCVAPVNTVAEAVDDPGYRARGAVVDAIGPAGERFRQVAPVWAGAAPVDEPVEVRHPAATDTAALLREAGMDDDAVAALLDEGVIA